MHVLGLFCSFWKASALNCARSVFGKQTQKPEAMHTAHHDTICTLDDDRGWMPYISLKPSPFTHIHSPLQRRRRWFSTSWSRPVVSPTGRLQQPQTRLPTAHVVSSKWPCLRPQCLLPRIGVHVDAHENATQLLVFTCSWKLLYIGSLWEGEREMEC